MRMSGLLCIISAPSGTGKTTLIRSITKNSTYFLYHTQVAISYTTRPKRCGELHGKEYYFVSKEKFRYMINSNMFFEYAKIFNNYYGTEKNNIESMLKSGIHVILNLDYQGVKNVRNAISKNIYTIFILPPSKKELENRLRSRGKDTDTIIVHRMNTAIHEIKHCKEYDYIVINDDFKVALIHIQSIILSEQLRLKQKTNGYDYLISSLSSLNF